MREAELRETLVHLLDRWSRRELVDTEVLETAEDIWDSEDKWPQLPRTDSASIPIEVIGRLSMLNVQLVCVQDIPEILRFLQSSTGDESKAWGEWDSYWGSIDYKTRARALHESDLYLTGEFVR